LDVCGRLENHGDTQKGNWHHPSDEIWTYARRGKKLWDLRGKREEHFSKIIDRVPEATPFLGNLKKRRKGTRKDPIKKERKGLSS